MALAAPGLRAMPSTAAAMALPCARPHRLEPIAIAKAAETGTQCPLSDLYPGVPGSWAQSVKLASRNSASSIRNVFFVIRFSFDESPPGGGSRTPCSRAHTESGIKPVLMFVRHRATHVHHGQQHENIRLHHTH